MSGFVMLGKKVGPKDHIQTLVTSIEHAAREPVIQHQKDWTCHSHGLGVILTVWASFSRFGRLSHGLEVFPPGAAEW